MSDKADDQRRPWLRHNWRPIVMLTLTALVVAHWLGLTADNVSEAEAIEMFSLIKLGLGGYVIGRSVEKVAPHVAAAMKGEGK